MGIVSVIVFLAAYGFLGKIFLLPWRYAARIGVIFVPWGVRTDYSGIFYAGKGE